MRSLAEWDAILEKEDDDDKEENAYAMDLATAQEIAASRAESTAIADAKSRNEPSKSHKEEPTTNGQQAGAAQRQARQDDSPPL